MVVGKADCAVVIDHCLTFYDVIVEESKYMVELSYLYALGKTQMEICYVTERKDDTGSWVAKLGVKGFYMDMTHIQICAAVIGVRNVREDLQSGGEPVKSLRVGASGLVGEIEFDIEEI